MAAAAPRGSQRLSRNAYSEPYADIPNTARYDSLKDSVRALSGSAPSATRKATESRVRLPWGLPIAPSPLASQYMSAARVTDGENPTTNT